MPLKLSLTPNLVKRCMRPLIVTKHVISPAESHSPTPHIIYLHNQPRAANVSKAVDSSERKGPDPRKMCF